MPAENPFPKSSQPLPDSPLPDSGAPEGADEAAEDHDTQEQTRGGPARQPQPGQEDGPLAGSGNTLGDGSSTKGHQG